MLLQGVDFFTAWVFGNEAIVVDGVDVALLAHHVSEAPV